MPPTHRWIAAFGAVLVGAVLVSALIAVRPLASGRSELDQVSAGQNAAERLATLRTTLADWQLFVERRLTLVTPSGTKLDSADLAAGTRLVTNAQTQQVLAATALRSFGMRDDAATLSRAATAFDKSVSDLTPLVTGTTANAINAAIAAMRAGFAATWAATSAALDHVTAQTVRDLHEGGEHLDNGRAIVVGVDALFIAVIVIATGWAVVRARRRGREQLDVVNRQAFESSLQEALEMAKTEPAVYGVLEAALPTVVPALQVEILVADSSRAHFQRTLTTAPENGGRTGCGVVSPEDCPATIRAHALLFPSSRALNACPYLKDRASGACSAACVPLSIAGNTVGVAHATGGDGRPPSDRDVRYLQVASRRASERLAMVRAFERSEIQAQSDPLTGLLNRRSLEDRLRDVQREGSAYVLAYGDLDQFKALNDTHGHEMGDQALRLFARVLRDSVRPHDLVARYGGEEFVILLPDCDPSAAVGVLERVRERLALALTSGRVPSFTVSFGVASSTRHDDFGATLAAADAALLRAKAAGRNRVVQSDAVDTPVAPVAPAVPVAPADG